MRLHIVKVIAPALAAAAAAISAAHAAGGAVPGAPNRYESTRTVSPCSPGNNFCQLTFAAVPAGNVLEATNISCEAGLSGPTSFDFMEFVLTSDSTRKAHEKTAFPIKAAEPAHFFLNEAIRLYFDTGAQPTLAISNAPGDASGFLLCTLSGALLKRAA